MVSPPLLESELGGSRGPAWLVRSLSLQGHAHARLTATQRTRYGMGPSHEVPMVPRRVCFGDGGSAVTPTTIPASKGPGSPETHVARRAPGGVGCRQLRGGKGARRPDTQGKDMGPRSPALLRAPASVLWAAATRRLATCAGAPAGRDDSLSSWGFPSSAESGPQGGHVVLLGRGKRLWTPEQRRDPRARGWPRGLAGQSRSLRGGAPCPRTGRPAWPRDAGGLPGTGAAAASS